MEDDKGSIKERILTAATRLFAENGFNGLSIDDLAKDAKINKSMIYYYFSNKEGLLITIIQNHIREFEEEFNKLDFSGSKEMDSVFTRVIRLAVDYITRNKDLVLILAHETFMKIPKTRVDIINFINPVWDKLVKVLKPTFPGIREVAMVDRLLCVALIVDFVLILSRIDTADEQDIEEVKELYIRRVTKIFEYLLTDKEII